MGQLYDDIPQSLFEWINKQHMFWVATAPLNAQGHVNVSPKGTADCFHVLHSKQVWYEDLTGSGVETISHVRENGRITVMFCAFEGPPRILRLFGVGTVHEYGSPEYNRLIPAGSRKPGSRSAIVIDVYQVGTSCGWGVPLYDHVMHRTQHPRISNMVENVERALAASRNQQNPDQDHDASLAGGGGDASLRKMSMRQYWLLENKNSVDGLPGLLTGPDAMLVMPPQSNFNKDGPRPMLRRSTDVSSIARDRKLVAFGFVLGAVIVFAITRFAGGLKG
ncbi:hypothetical protein OG21DRAFT_1511169 [Imleria badia]|nr:hypothetical protein OG21DRAFT_1511169 [Imleria badia]